MYVSFTLQECGLTQSSYFAHPVHAGKECTGKQQRAHAGYGRAEILSLQRWVFSYRAAGKAGQHRTYDYPRRGM